MRRPLAQYRRLALLLACRLVSLAAQQLPAANEVAGRRLADAAPLDSRWFEDARCECCKDAKGVPFSRLYNAEIHKNCFGGEDGVGFRVEDALAQSTDGSLTVRPIAQRMVCASHRCRGSITTFWDAVHACAASGYWKVIALAFATAKSQCHKMETQSLQETGQWLTRIRATFHGIDTSDDGAMLQVEHIAERSAAEALSSVSDGSSIDPGHLEVKCSSVPPFTGPLGADSVRLDKPKPPPNATCARVTSRWPANDEQGVDPDLQYIILHFDRCIRATNETVLKLSVLPRADMEDDIHLQHGTSDLPKETLIFPLGSGRIGPNRVIHMSLAGEAVVSCENEEPICDGFESVFYTAVSDPRVVRTDLVEDRWLRSIFDLPVEAAEDAFAKFDVTLEPAPDQGGYPNQVVTATAGVNLMMSSNMIVHGRRPHNATGLSILQEERCVYTRAPAPNSLSCHDGRIYEVDLCDKFKCTGSRLPCGARVKAEYPKGMAFRNASEVKSLAGIGRAFTRTCAPPKLVDTIPETVIEGSQVQIKWSQPVRFSSEGRKGKRRFSLCHAATQELACPIVDEAFDESKVFPCTGPGGDCALWSIKVNTGQLPTCGGFIVTIEAGAVESEEGTGANELTRSWIQSEHHCPRWAEGSSCSLVDSDGLRSMYNRSHVSPTQLQLQVDLDHMQLRYNVLPPDFNFTVRRLASKSYLPRCLIVSPLPDFAQKLKQNFSQSLFEYVRLGGQLYVLGSSTNVEIMSQAFNLSLEAAETGNEQVRTMPAPNEALGFDSGLPTTLPVINQVLSLQMPSTTSIRDGHVVSVAGIYSRGHVVPSAGWYGFGAFEVRVHPGIAEYLAFDWHERRPARREPWARLLQMLVEINLRRWAPPPASLSARRLEEGSWEPPTRSSWRTLKQCPPAQLPPKDAEDVTCTFSLLCPEEGTMPGACQSSMHELTEIVQQQTSPLLTRMRFHCLHLTLQHYSPAFMVKLPERCPHWAAIEEATEEMKAACGFGYGPDASVLDVEVIKTDLGVEAFSSDVRSNICQQSFCRGQVARFADLFKSCPGEAGLKGERARLARMLKMALRSCARAGAAKLNVQDRFAIKGVNVLSPGEHDGLANVVKEALTEHLSLQSHFWWFQQNWILSLIASLSGMPVASSQHDDASLISVMVHPLYPKADAWEHSFASLLGPVPGGQDVLAAIPQDLPGGACQACTVRNLQVMAVQPSIGSENVDPAGSIRIFFDSVIVMDNPHAKIRIYPRVFEELCKEVDPRSFYPWDTGTGELQVATLNRHATELAPGIPITAICQEHAMEDSMVKVGDEVLQITPRHPMMRNTEIVVEIDPWAVRSADVLEEERYPARWTGWKKSHERVREVLSFTTGSPLNSEAEVSVAVGCGWQPPCETAQKTLTMASSILADLLECFIAWYRCSGDSTSPQVCHTTNLPWCDISLPSWASVAAAAPALEQVDEDEVVLEGEPLELRSSVKRHAAVPPVFLWGGMLLSYCVGLVAVHRAALWLVDEYWASREFDPFVKQSLDHFPLFLLVLLAFVPIMVALSAAFWSPIFYHRAALFEGSVHHASLGGIHTPTLQAHVTAAFERLQMQMEWAAATGLGSSVCVLSIMAYATIAMCHQCYFDAGQIVAITAFFLAWGALLGGTCNFISATAPTERERISGRELKFEAAVFTICGTVFFSLLSATLLSAVASVLFTMLYPGTGDILKHFLRYSWMQHTQWYDRQSLKVIGRWDCWILHVRDLQLIHGFRVSIDGRHQEDGFITIQFHATDDPYNIVTTRSVPVRAVMQRNMNPFEGDNVKINIGSWRTILVVNVMYQHQNGAQPQKVAGGLWDPWTGQLLQKCFTNAVICDPDPGQGGKFKLWDFQDLIDSDGKPKEGCYVEARVNLTPCNGLLSLQLTHLGPKAVLEERDDPSDQPSKELFLGDTIIGDGGFTRKVHRQHEATAPAPSTGIGAISSISGFQTLDKMGIGGIELEMRYTGAIPKRYGEAQGRHLGPFALGPDEWVQAVLQQSQDKNPRHFGNALTFFTSTGHVHTLRGEGATRLQHLGASRGFQIRELKFQGSRLKEISVAPVDKKGLQEINWWAWGDDVEYVEFVFRDGSKPQGHGRTPSHSHHSSQLKPTRKPMAPAEYLIAVTQEEGESRNLGNSLTFFTSHGNVLSAAGKKAEKDLGGRFAATDGTQITGLKMEGGALVGVETASARPWE